jgi:hypothetical protein
MSDDVAEEYHRSIAPDLFRDLDPAWRDLTRNKSWPTVEQMEAARRRRWHKHLSNFDDSILEAAGLSVDDLIEYSASKNARRSGGRMLPQEPERVKQRERAYSAIHAADLAGKSWAQTIDDAQAASLFRSGNCDCEIDRKTLDRWLRSLREWGLIKLELPEPKGRGRPQKKE